MERSPDEKNGSSQVLEETQAQPVRDNSNSSQESLPPRPDRWIEQTAPRPELDGPDASKFDREAIDDYIEMLDIECCLQGPWDKLSKLPREESPHPIAKTSSSRLVRVRISRVLVASKKCWTPDSESRQIHEKEVEVLKTLSEQAHWHVILLIFPYSPQGNEGCLVLSPLAQCNLKEYLQLPSTQGRQRIIAKWFGCLAKGLSVLHSKKIKHKDLKPANILVHGENVLIADVGISHPWVDRSTTTGTSPGSRKYMAPEVLKEERRGRRQDIWSLLCCYIEMISYLTETPLQLHDPQNFYENYAEVIEFLKSLRRSIQDVDDNKVVDYILKSFQINPEERPYAPEMVDVFRKVGHGNKYIGECCASGPVSGTTALSPQMDAMSISSKFPIHTKKTLMKFVEIARTGAKGALVSAAVDSGFHELVLDVTGGRVRSIRSVENKFLLYIAQRECQSAREYLRVCNTFVKVLADVIEGDRDSPYASGAYGACLYDEQLGEQEQPYTTAYFAIMIDVILSRCRTSRWGVEDGA